jgi:hypothetical protein
MAVRAATAMLSLLWRARQWGHNLLTIDEPLPPLSEDNHTGKRERGPKEEEEEK